MFVVQIGHYTWLSRDDLPPTTSSGRHAKQFGTLEAATAALAAFDADRRGAMRHESGPMRDHYADPARVPGSVVPLAEHQARMATVAQPRTPAAAVAPASQATGSEPAPGAPAMPAAPRAKGVTTLIREWVAAHPLATKADAYAQFPDANRSTVNVQFGAARKGA